MLDARSKTILEAWHTEVDGVSFGQQEQNESGNFKSSTPFEKFSKRNLGGSGGSLLPLIMTLVKLGLLLQVYLLEKQLTQINQEL